MFSAFRLGPAGSGRGLCDIENIKKMHFSGLFISYRYHTVRVRRRPDQYEMLKHGIYSKISKSLNFPLELMQH